MEAQRGRGSSRISHEFIPSSAIPGVCANGPLRITWVTFLAWACFRALPRSLREKWLTSRWLGVLGKLKEWIAGSVVSPYRGAGTGGGCGGSSEEPHRHDAAIRNRYVRGSHPYPQLLKGSRIVRRSLTNNPHTHRITTSTNQLEKT